MPTKRHCCVSRCENDGTLEENSFYPFPTDLDERKIWLENLDLEKCDFESDFVCSKHFVDGQPTGGNPFPIIMDSKAYGNAPSAGRMELDESNVTGHENDELLSGCDKDNPNGRATENMNGHAPTEHLLSENGGKQLEAISDVPTGKSAKQRTNSKDVFLKCDHCTVGIHACPYYAIVWTWIHACYLRGRGRFMFWKID